MSHARYDRMWRECMTTLATLEPPPPRRPDPKAPAPEDPALAIPEPPPDARTREDYHALYVEYLKLFRDLEETYDGMCHPQKRDAVRAALEATLGRVIELREWIVKLNDDLDAVNLEETLINLRLGPDALEVPIPRYFVGDRERELSDRATFLESLLEKRGRAAIDWDAPPAKASFGAAAEREEDASTREPTEEEEAARAAEEAERLERESELEMRAAALVASRTAEENTAKIQAHVRGFLTRRHVRRMREAELIFLGMLPPPKPPPEEDLYLIDAANRARRRAIKEKNLEELDEAMVTLKDRVRELDGQEMRDHISGKINEWFVENRDAKTGDYPDFPKVADGGSRDILNPPPKPEPVPVLTPEEEKKKKAEDEKKKKEAEKKKKEAEKKAAEKEKKKEEAKKKGIKWEDPDDIKPPPRCADAFVTAVHAAAAAYDAEWRGKSGEDADETNFDQKFEQSLVLARLKPVVFEEIRAEVDEDMRALLENLKELVAAEKAAKAGGKGGKKGKGKGKGGKKGGGGGGKKKGGKKAGGGGKGGKKGKGKKDPTADRTLESLFAELVENGIVQKTHPGFVMDAYVGDPISFCASALERAGGKRADCSHAQVRESLTTCGVLPIGCSSETHAKLPSHVRAILLAGHPGSGKTLLTHAVANGAGATFFNVSPRNTDDVYAGKQSSVMLHTVFKVAKMTAPSVIYIDEVEKVFCTDKKLSKTWGLRESAGRIKKDLLKEVKALKPGDRVVVIGNAREPWTCAKKDHKAFCGFFDKIFVSPAPEYGARRAVWTALIARRGNGSTTPPDFAMSTLAHLSEGHTPGTMDAVVREVLTEKRIEEANRLPFAAAKPLTADEFLIALAEREPAADAEASGALRDWVEALPARVALIPEPEPEEDAKKK